MELTSAQANRMLVRLEDEREELLAYERESREFVAATIEDPESARPAYDYGKTQERIAEIERKIRILKHGISLFNLTHEVEGTGMTVDQVLVYLPQLRDRKRKLGEMAAQLPKKRMTTSSRSNIIEYEYVNYDVDLVKADHIAVTDELTRVKLALERLNTTETMELDL